MSRVGRRMARAALKLAPRQWRERYGDEVAELTDAIDTDIQGAADVARIALRQHVEGHMHIRFETAQRHPRAFAVAGIVTMLPTMTLVAVSLIGYQLGFGALARAIDPIITSLAAIRAVDLGLVVAPLIGFVLALMPLAEIGVEPYDGAPTMTLRVRAIGANLLVGATALALGLVLVAHIVGESVLQVGPRSLAPGFSWFEGDHLGAGVLAQLLRRARKDRERTVVDRDDGRGADHLERQPRIARAHRVVTADR